MYRGKPIWILAANAGHARLWSAASPSAELVAVREFDNPDGRAHERELTTDLPGRAFDSAGEGRHVMEQQVSPKKEAAIRFATELARHLRDQRESFDKLYIVASPEFLGLLRQSLNSGLGNTPIVELTKDYTALDARELRNRLPEYL